MTHFFYRTKILTLVVHEADGILYRLRKPWTIQKANFCRHQICRTRTTYCWVAKVRILFRLSATGVEDIENFADVQYTEVTNVVSGVDRSPFCVCLRWENAHAEDRTLDIVQGLLGTPFEEREVLWALSFWFHRDHGKFVALKYSYYANH